MIKSFIARERGALRAAAYDPRHLRVDTAEPHRPVLAADDLERRLSGYRLGAIA